MEMVKSLLSCRVTRKKLEDDNDTYSEHYYVTCQALEDAEEIVGKDWDGVTVLQDNNVKPTLTMPDYIVKAIAEGDIKSVLRWINANRTGDRANAVTSAEMLGFSCLIAASLRCRRKCRL